jgi:DNA polymerase-3 subunit delta
MIIKYFDFIKNFNAKSDIYLLYGENSALIEDTIEKFFKLNFSRNVFTYEESDILENTRSFKEKIFTRSFFEDDKLIIINRISDKILDTILEINKKKIIDIKIILKAGTLEKKSKIRKLFEQSKEFTTIPFYEDNHKTLFFLTENFFKKKKIKISLQTINLIIEQSKYDRATLNNELRKIEMFLMNKSKLDYTDVLKITNTSEKNDFSLLTDMCLLKNKRTSYILNSSIIADNEIIIIIKNFLYKLKRLKKLKEDLIEKKNIDTILSSYKPTIFWKEKDAIKKQLQLYSIEKIKHLIEKINNLEYQVKKNSQISFLVLSDFILENTN